MRPILRVAMRRHAIGAVLTAVILSGAGCNETHAQSRYTFTHGAMGTEFRIVLFAADSLSAAAAATAAFDRIDSLDRTLSDYLVDSELNRLSDLSGADTLVSVSDDLWRVLSSALLVAEASDGAFDPTVGASTRLWRHWMRRNTLPPPEALSAALVRVGYLAVRMDSTGRRVGLRTPGLRLDLGGIAKGFAADEAGALLSERGISAALVDAGGDVRLGDPPPGSAGWRIAVPAVDSAGAVTQAAVVAARGAIATSGDTYRSIEVDGTRYSHILDPKTGMGVTFRRLVTVCAPTGTIADALASALSVLPLSELESFLSHFPGASARLVFPDPASPGKWTTRDSIGWPFPSSFR